MKQQVFYQIFNFSEYNSTDVYSYVAWNNGIFNIPLPNQENDACLSSINCPVVANQVTRFTYHLPIDSFWPAVSIKLIHDFSLENLKIKEYC